MFDLDTLLCYISFTYFICWSSWQLTQNPFHWGIRSPCFVFFSQSPKFWVKTNPRFLKVCLCIPHVKVWCHEGWSCWVLKSWVQGTRTIKRLLWLACVSDSPEIMSWKHPDLLPPQEPSKRVTSFSNWVSFGHIMNSSCDFWLQPWVFYFLHCLSSLKNK